MRSSVIVPGGLAFKFARNERGRANNLHEAGLCRNANATRRALLCPVLWMSRNGSVQNKRSAKPKTDMMSLDEYLHIVLQFGILPRANRPVRPGGRKDS